MMNEAQITRSPGREKAVRDRLRSDFEYYAPRCLKILTKPDDKGNTKLVPFNLNPAQRIIHQKVEEQRARLGYVRALILKGRQQGASTYVEGRYYWKTTQRSGQKTYILTHKQEATENLFTMVDRYHTNCPVFVKPRVGKDSAKELEFPALDSKYQVATAGSKGAGRSATLTNVHGSEVGFWENGEEHLAGMLQAVPLAAGTEVILESTANGVGNIFHKHWQMAVLGQSDFIAIFIPWFLEPGYRRPVPDDFELDGDPESVPEGELTEVDYAAAFNLDDEQMYWRRRKIIELGGGEEGFYLFKQEYPATADEAFQSSSGHSFLSRKAVLRARKSAVATEGPLIIGVDPGGDKEGNDPSCILRRRTRRIFGVQQFTTLNTMQLAARIHHIIKTEKPVRVFVDVGGKGAGVVDRLAELEGTAGIVVPVNFGEAALDPERYVNLKAEMAWKLRDWLDDPGGANIPDDDDVQADLLSSVADDPDSNQRRRLKTKKWMRSQGLPSPNIFDAACTTFAMPLGEGAYTTQVGNANSDFDPVDYAHGSGGQIGSSSVDFDVF